METQEGALADKAMSTYWEQQYRREEATTHHVRAQLHKEQTTRMAAENALRQLAKYVEAKGYEGVRLPNRRIRPGPSLSD